MKLLVLWITTRVIAYSAIYRKNQIIIKWLLLDGLVNNYEKTYVFKKHDKKIDKIWVKFDEIFIFFFPIFIFELYLSFRIVIIGVET